MGLSVLDTARKLRATRNDALCDKFVDEFLPASGKGPEAERNARLRFHLDCDSLGQKQQFAQLLSKVEPVRSRFLWPPAWDPKCGVSKRIIIVMVAALRKAVVQHACGRNGAKLRVIMQHHTHWRYMTARAVLPLSQARVFCTARSGLVLCAITFMQRRASEHGGTVQAFRFCGFTASSHNIRLWR